MKFYFWFRDAAYIRQNGKGSAKNRISEQKANDFAFSSVRFLSKSSGMQSKQRSFCFHSRAFDAMVADLWEHQKWKKLLVSGFIHTFVAKLRKTPRTAPDLQTQDKQLKLYNLLSGLLWLIFVICIMIARRYSRQWILESLLQFW